jgi:MinD-like ATPase involved in chromosome partitioning or flagellar assembly
MSYRGGTGKSIFALNLANTLANSHNTLLIEADFLAPSLIYTFKNSKDTISWNDYLLQRCELKDLLQQIEMNNSKLKIVFTKPHDEELFKSIQDKQAWKGYFFERINQFFSIINKKLDFIIIDNQSGTFLSTATHMFFSDYIVCLVRPDVTDLPGTAEYAKMLKKNFFIIWNQVISKEGIASIIKNWNKEYFEGLENYKDCLGIIPFDEETAYQRWILGEAIIKGTDFQKNVDDISEKLIDLKDRMELDKN